GVLRRFPTVPAGSAGFVVADERTLAAALDAQLPGQGRPDELWIASRRLAPLRAALRRVDLVGLQARYRRRLERELRDAPIARAVLGTLVAAAAMSAALAIVGLLSALLGAARDRRTESDLTDQGAGPRAVRGQLRLEAMIASALGVVGGAALALALASLTVVTVRAVATLASGAPPLVTVDPAGELVLWSAAGLVALALATWLATAGGARGAPW
ncbi:MAG: FtsX-like permease family protein, partial [Solirubrobacteraceae bacterium]